MFCLELIRIVIKVMTKLRFTTVVQTVSAIRSDHMTMNKSVGFDNVIC